MYGWWEKNFFDWPINNDKITYENIRKVAIGQGDDYATGCLLYYSYFKENYKTIVIDLNVTDNSKVACLCKTFANCLSTDIKLFKTQLSEMI